jgi:transcription initiation factor TFIIE subunit alpha
MQINFLKKVVENAAGEAAVKIVDLIYGKKDVNEFLIAKKLGLTINQTRNLIYRLSHMGIINSIRKKDKRKGWYIYFWTFDILKSLEVLHLTLSTEIAALEYQLNNKQTLRFYKCPICGREANEEAALQTNFSCTECGEVYQLADSTHLIDEITKKLEKLKKERALINEEILIEKEKIDLKLNRFLKKEAKTKKELRRKNSEIRKKLSDKLKKVKKPVKSSKKKL